MPFWRGRLPFTFAGERTFRAGRGIFDPYQWASFLRERRFNLNFLSKRGIFCVTRSWRLWPRGAWESQFGERPAVHCTGLPPFSSTVLQYSSCSILVGVLLLKYYCSSIQPGLELKSAVVVVLLSLCSSFTDCPLASRQGGDPFTAPVRVSFALGSKLSNPPAAAKVETMDRNAKHCNVFAMLCNALSSWDMVENKIIEWTKRFPRRKGFTNRNCYCLIFLLVLCPESNTQVIMALEQLCKSFVGLLLACSGRRCAKNPWDLSAWAHSCSSALKLVVTIVALDSQFLATARGPQSWSSWLIFCFLPNYLFTVWYDFSGNLVGLFSQYR